MDKISKEEALNIVEGTPVEDDVEAGTYKYSFLQTIKTDAELDALEREDIIRLRRRWSEWILFCIVLITVLDIVIILLIGSGSISFKEGYIIPTFIGESIAKIIILAVIIVKFLFNSNSKNK